MKSTSQNLLAPRSISGLVNTLLNSDFPRFFRDDFFNDSWTRSEALVPVNIKEEEKSFILEIVAPGLSKDKFSIQVNDDVLAISFENKEREEEKSESGKWIRTEYKTRSFKRSFNLGEKVDVEQITAKYENGVLVIDLPKKETVAATNKVIEIA